MSLIRCFRHVSYCRISGSSLNFTRQSLYVTYSYCRRVFDSDVSACLLRDVVYTGIQQLVALVDLDFSNGTHAYAVLRMTGIT